MADIYQGNASGLDSPGVGHYAVTPSDSTNFAVAFRGLYVGGAGDVVLVGLDGTPVTYKAVPVGSIIPMRGVRVNSTNTTATYIVAMY